MKNHKFSVIKKDKLFYDRFEYCIGFYLDEVSCLRVLDHDYIDDIIARRQQWREICQQRWAKSKISHPTILTRDWKEITDQVKEDLHSLATVLLATQISYKLVVSVNQAYVYSNDLTLINQLDAMKELKYKTYTRAQISRPKNTVALKNPRHQFRSYFKLHKLTADQKDQLMYFLQGQLSHVRLSPGLQRWFDGQFCRSQDYFFVDHDTKSWLTMLNLVSPGIIRKTMHIIPAK